MKMGVNMIVLFLHRIEDKSFMEFLHGNFFIFSVSMNWGWKTLVPIEKFQTAAYQSIEWQGYGFGGDSGMITAPLPIGFEEWYPNEISGQSLSLG